LTIDYISKRYGKLPSEVLNTASTFDIYVSDVAAKYQNYVYDKAEKNRKSGYAEPVRHNHSTDELGEMLKRAREDK
jgi:hypothetical protein